MNSRKFLCRTGLVTSIIASAASLDAATVTFSFEELAASTSNDGNLTYLELRDQGLVLDITRPGSSFDVREYPINNLPAEVGQNGLSPFSNQSSATPFVLNFSQPVNSVQVWTGDYGQDTPDIVTLRAFDGANASGSQLAFSQTSIPTLNPGVSTPNFDTVAVAPTGGGIQSATLLGGTPGFEHSVYYDNIVVEFDRVEEPGINQSNPIIVDLLTEPKRNIPTTTETSDFKLGGDFIDFNAELPTIVVVHGRQPQFFPEFTGDPRDVENLAQFYDNVEQRFPGEYNVILVTWEQAFVERALFYANDGDGLFGFSESFYVSVTESYDLGGEIADSLIGQFGDGYKHPVHLIGHSFGTAINNQLGLQLHAGGIDVGQMTVLDAPFDTGEATTVLTPELYEVAASAARAEIFDNYYGTKGNGPLGVLDPFSGEIPTAELNRGYPIDADHEGVFDVYVDSVLDDQLIQDGGFTNANFSKRIFPVDRQPTPLIVDFLLEQNSTFSSPISPTLAEGSDAFVFWRETNLHDFDFLYLQIDSLFLGDEDFFEIQIDGITQAFFDGGTSFFDREFYIPFFDNGDGSTSLSFFLNGRGEEDGRVEIGGFYGVGGNVTVAPVPLPMSFALQVFTLGFFLALGFAKRRR